jgi:hypothetical protein
MPRVDQQRADKLLALARERYDPELRAIEEQVLRHSCGYQDPPDWVAPAPESSAEGPPGDAHSEPSAEPHPTLGPAGRPLPGRQGPELRSGLLRWLLTDPEATGLLEPRGLRVWNVRLAEPLDLTGCRVPVRVELRYCLVEAAIRLASADLPTLSVRNSTLQLGLDAPFLTLHGPLLVEDVAAAETLRFDGATIEGEARVSDATLTADGTALSMQGASIANDLLLSPGLTSAGGLLVKGVRVGGFIDLSGAQLTNTDTALHLDNAVVHGAVYLQNRFESAGMIRMIDAEIGGQLACNSAKLTTAKIALELYHCKIGGGIFCATASNRLVKFG